MGAARRNPYDRPHAGEAVTCQIWRCSATFTLRWINEDDARGMPIEDAARAVGWTVWQGYTLGGTHTAVSLCPGHRDADAEDGIDPTETAPVWGASCDTCRDGDDGLTRDEAEGWMEGHQCEPEVRLVHPKPTAVGMAERRTG